MATKIRGIEGMKGGELEFEIQRGGKFVLFQYCISVIVLTFRRPSDIYFLRQGESAVTKGLPSRFGFALAVPAAEKQTLFTIPIDSAENRFVPQGRLRVARSRDGGKSWKLLTKGLPQSGAYVLILREAMSSDNRDPAGVYFGTSTGTLWHTREAGDSWHALAENLPPIYSITVSYR